MQAGPSTRRVGFVGCATLASVLLLASTVDAGSRTWTSDADFNGGTSTNLIVGGDAITVDVDGVGLPDPTIAWWDGAWGQRRCIDVTNNEATTLTEFQIAIDVDTATPISGGRMNASGDDIRFIAADGTTELDYWIDGPMNTAATAIWVQTDTLPAGPSTICMYYDNAAAPSMSDIYAPFSYSTPRDLYVAVSETQAGDPIAVTSYVANNTISDGLTTVTLGVGGTHTFPGPGHTPSTVVSATGPIAIQGTANNGDSFVPLAFAGTEFVVASQRSSNRVSLYAPFAAANVTIQHGATTTNVAVPAGTSVSTPADVGTSQAAIITSDEPILATHQTGNNIDAFVVPPASDSALYGIRSTLHITGFGSAGTSVNINESTGASTSIGGGFGGSVSRSAGGSFGSGPAVIATPTAGGPIGAIQQADSDGSESTAYWPRSELNVVYRSPVDIDYISFACPNQSTGNIESDGATLDCTGAGGAGFPGKALDSGGASAGALHQSLDGMPFYVYAEDDAHNDENNILGPKQARLSTTNPPTVLLGAEQSRYEANAQWTSDAHDTGCAAFFGDLSWNPPAQPAGTNVEFQVASAPTAGGPFSFLGPDGTASTFYTAAGGTAIAAVHDGDQFVQVSATLTSNAERIAAPTVTDVSVDWLGATQISGTLFGDVDADGTNDPSDPGLAGIDVTLWLDDGDGIFDELADTEITTVTSAAGGLWQFPDQPAGSYFAVADETQLPAGYVTPGTTPNPFGPINAGECASTDIAIGWEPTGTITTTVFSDVDGDGSMNGSDSGIAGIAVGIWLDDGDGLFDANVDLRVRVVTTDSSGVAAATELPIGAYFAYVAPGSEPAGHNVGATTDNPAGILNVAVGDQLPVGIGFQPVGGLTGTAFVDTNGDGVQQSGESGVPQLRIDVYEDDGDGVFDPASDTFVSTTTTNPTGDYLTSGLAPGEYWIVPSDPPPPSLPSAPLAATVAGDSATVVDIPFAQAGTIAGIVVFDSDGTVDPGSVPIAGMTVALHRDNGDGTFDPAIDPQVGLRLTDASGEFVFTDVAPGDYFVRIVPSPLLGERGPALVGANPLGPVEPGAVGLVFAFDPTSVVLPETGATAAGLGIRLGAAIMLTGFFLLGLGRRRRAAI